MTNIVERCLLQKCAGKSVPTAERQACTTSGAGDQLDRLAAPALIDNHPVANLELLVKPLGDLVVAQLAATVRAALVALVGEVL